MILSAFEKLAHRLEVEPLEVRMKAKHVKWMICRDKENNLVVIDGNTYVFRVKDYKWPEDVSTIHLEHNYIDCDKIDNEIFVSGEIVEGKPMSELISLQMGEE